MIIGNYSIIYADPPWQYQRSKVQGAAENHYPTMGIDELCALPVADLAAPDSALFLWATFPQLPAALRLIDARVPSILIAGGSNFPVRKKEKQNAARDKNMGEYMQIEGLLDKVRSTGMGGISADDDRAVEKLEAKLAGLEAMQKEMKTVNAYYRKHKTLEGCPVLSAEEIGKLQSSMASDWRKNPVPYPSYLLTNNNANIRRTRQRIEDLKSQSEYAGWAFPGGRAEINEGENRLQLFFEEKPSEEQRRELKSNGFKWAPSQGAWQRQLTKNAIYAAGRMEFLRPEDGQSPYQLQPFARKTEKDMTR